MSSRLVNVNAIRDEITFARQLVERSAALREPMAEMERRAILAALVDLEDRSRMCASVERTWELVAEAETLKGRFYCLWGAP